MKTIIPAKLLMSLSILLFISQAQAQKFTWSYNASAKGSDYYMYFTYSFGGDKCDCDNSYGMKFKWSGGSKSYSGSSKTDEAYAVGPSISRTYSTSATISGKNNFIINCVNTCSGSGNSNGSLTRSTAAIKRPASASQKSSGLDFIEVDWTKGTDIPNTNHSYRIYRDNVGPEYLVAQVSGSTRSWIDTDVGPGETHRYYITTYSTKWGVKESSSRSVLASSSGDELLIADDGESLGRTLVKWPNLPNNNKDIQVWRDDELLATLPKEATSYSDDAGLPGFSYSYYLVLKKSVGELTDDGKYQVVEKDRSYPGLTDTGFRTPNGKIRGEVRAPFGGPVADVQVCAELLDDIPQGNQAEPVCAVTDETGYFEIRDIYYHETARFRIVPSKGDHGFSPASVNRTLDLNSPSISGLNFTDTTSFTVQGNISQMLAGSACGLEGVEIWINDNFKGFTTDAQGNFNVTIEEIGQYKIEPRFQDHVFSPSEVDMFIEEDVFDLQFDNLQQQTLSGYVKGTCDIYLGQADLRIWSEDGGGACIDTTIRTNEGSGYYEIALPARPYQIELVDFFSDDESIVPSAEVKEYFSVDTTDLTLSPSQKDFIYRKAPQISLLGMPDEGCAPYEVPIAEQSNIYPLEINITEVFGSEACPADTGYVVIVDGVSFDNPKPDTLPISNGFVFYDLIPGEPNILSPYQKSIDILAVVGDEQTQLNQKVLITGNRAREKTFLSVSPELPFMILRDPPGDASYSYVEKESSAELGLRLFAQREASVKKWSELKMGNRVEVGTPFANYKIENWGKIGGSFEVGGRVSAQTEAIMTFTNTERFSTSDNPLITGEEGDVFLGSAMNLIYALTDVIDYNPNTCLVEESTSVIMGNDGFATNFVYTEDHIRNTLIPQLQQLRDIQATSNPDSAKIYENQISVWQQTLNLNKDLKNKAVYVENRSFSAGTPFANSQSISHSASGSIEFAFFMEASIAKEAGFEIAGSGASGGVEARLRMEVGGAVFGGLTQKRTTGYVLNDDDQGDFFSVDIMEDETYGTPVFNLVSGRSRCPWEPSTQPREGVQLLADSYIQTDIPADDPAVFVLNLGNVSQSDENRTYELVFLQESNPDGAALTLGGSEIQGGVPTPYTIEAGKALNATVTVRRGPLAYDYQDLQFVLRSTCDIYNVNDTISLSAFFNSPCSEVSLVSPEPNWVVGGDDGEFLSLNIRNYDRNALQQIVLEYAPSIGGDWQSITAFEKDELSTNSSGTFYSWNIGNLPDGAYKVRAKVNCDAGVIYSDRSEGILDRRAPQVFGVPEPTDGIFNDGDLISISFDEALNCLTIDPGMMKMIRQSDQLEMDFDAGCSENRIIFVPDASISLAGQEVEISLLPGSLGDQFNNFIDEQISWNFEVDAESSVEINDQEDTDGDRILNSEDNCPLAANPDQSDLDGDGIGDVCDDDLDGDGIANADDNCPFTPNPGQEDADNNGIGDVCEPEADGDGDGIANNVDNCPFTANPGQEDMDNDGIGDVCDEDVDGDGVINAKDNCATVPNPGQETVACGNATSVSEDIALDFITVYPHPMTDLGNIQLNLEQAEDIQLDIYDLQGKWVMNLMEKERIYGTHDMSLDSNVLANGLYFLHIQKGRNIHIMKLMVAN